MPYRCDLNPLISTHAGSCLFQELAKFEIDTRNIIINQVIFPEAADGSKLLQARVRMQAKVGPPSGCNLDRVPVLVLETYWGWVGQWGGAVGELSGGGPVGSWGKIGVTST